MSALKREVVFLILQFLNEEGFEGAARTLEHDSGFYFNLNFFEDMILNGNWVEAEKYLSGFTKLDDNRYSTKIFFEIRKQNFLEALDKNERAKALEILMTDLKVFASINEEVFAEMTQLLTLNDIREHESLANYGDVESVRRLLMLELRKIIQANPSFSDKLKFPNIRSQRLQCLINQGLNWQHILCKHPHPNPQINSLYVDHVCPPPEDHLSSTLTGNESLPPESTSLPTASSSGSLKSTATTVIHSEISSRALCSGTTKDLDYLEDANVVSKIFPSDTYDELSIDGSSTVARAGLVDEAPKDLKSLEAGKCQFWGEADIKLFEINNPCQLQILRLQSHVEANQILDLVYGNAGNFILALTSNAIHLLWKWQLDDRNLNGKAITEVSAHFWQPKSCTGLMKNGLKGTNCQEAFSHFALSKNDSYLMSTSGGKISLFNMLTFKKMLSIMSPPPRTTSLVFLPQDNNIIAIGRDDSTIVIYNVRLSKVISTLVGHSSRVSSLAFSEALNILISAGGDAQILVWNVQGWEKHTSRLFQTPEKKRPVALLDTHIQFHQDQIHFLAVNDTCLAIFEARGLECLKQWVPGDLAPISSATFSCDSQIVYASLVDGAVCIFDASSLEIQCRITPAAYRPPNFSSNVYPLVIAAHTQKPSQFAAGLTTGEIVIFEPLNCAGKWTNSTTGGGLVELDR